MTGDEPQGTMGKVQTVGKVVSFPPSFARTFSSRERRLGTRQVQARLGNWFDSDFFFRAACVTTCNKKSRFSCITGLRVHHQHENHRKELFSTELHQEILG